MRIKIIFGILLLLSLSLLSPSYITAQAPTPDPVKCNPAGLDNSNNCRDTRCVKKPSGRSGYLCVLPTPTKEPTATPDPEVPTVAPTISATTCTPPGKNTDGSCADSSCVQVGAGGGQSKCVKPTPTPDPSAAPVGCTPPGKKADGSCEDPLCAVVGAGGGQSKCVKKSTLQNTPTPSISPTPRTPAPPCKTYEVTEIKTQQNERNIDVIIPGKKTQVTVAPNKPLIFEEKMQYNCLEVETGLGPISTDPVQFVKKLFAIILSVSGGIALLLIIYSGYQLMLSQGNPEKINGAKETLTSAIIGLVFIIFSLVILQIIGVDILRLPGFSY